MHGISEPWKKWLLIKTKSWLYENSKLQYTKPLENSMVYFPDCLIMNTEVIRVAYFEPFLVWSYIPSDMFGKHDMRNQRQKQYTGLY